MQPNVPAHLRHRATLTARGEPRCANRPAHRVARSGSPRTAAFRLKKARGAVRCSRMLYGPSRLTPLRQSPREKNVGKTPTRRASTGSARHFRRSNRRRRGVNTTGRTWKRSECAAPPIKPAASMKVPTCSEQPPTLAAARDFLFFVPCYGRDRNARVYPTGESGRARKAALHLDERVDIQITPTKSDLRNSSVPCPYNVQLEPRASPSSHAVIRASAPS
jgi:hypothetical protein